MAICDGSDDDGVVVRRRGLRRLAATKVAGGCDLNVQQPVSSLQSAPTVTATEMAATTTATQPQPKEAELSTGRGLRRLKLDKAHAAQRQAQLDVQAEQRAIEQVEEDLFCSDFEAEDDQEGQVTISPQAPNPTPSATPAAPATRAPRQQRIESKQVEAEASGDEMDSDDGDFHLSDEDSEDCPVSAPTATRRRSARIAQQVESKQFGGADESDSDRFRPTTRGRTDRSSSSKIPRHGVVQAGLSEPNSNLACSDGESSDDGFSRVVERRAKGGMRSTSARGVTHLDEIGNDNDPEVPRWEGDLEGRRQPDMELRTAFSMKALSAKEIRGLGNQCYLMGLPIFDSNTRVNSSLLLGAYHQLRKQPECCSSEEARHIGWLARQAERLGVVSHQELRRGRVLRGNLREKDDADRRLFVVAETRLRFPTRSKSNISKGEKPVRSQIDGDGDDEDLFSDAEDEVEKVLKRKQTMADLRARHLARKSAIRTGSSCSLNMEKAVNDLLAPSLSFDFIREADKVPMDDEEEDDFLEVTVPTEGHGCVRNLWKDHIKKNQSQKWAQDMLTRHFSDGTSKPAAELSRKASGPPQPSQMLPASTAALSETQPTAAPTTGPSALPKSNGVLGSGSIAVAASQLNDLADAGALPSACPSSSNLSSDKANEVAAVQATAPRRSGDEPEADSFVGQEQRSASKRQRQRRRKLLDDSDSATAADGDDDVCINAAEQTRGTVTAEKGATCKRHIERAPDETPDGCRKVQGRIDSSLEACGGGEAPGLTNGEPCPTTPETQAMLVASSAPVCPHESANLVLSSEFCSPPKQAAQRTQQSILQRGKAPLDAQAKLTPVAAAIKPSEAGATVVGDAVVIASTHDCVATKTEAQTTLSDGAKGVKPMSVLSLLVKSRSNVEKRSIEEPQSSNAVQASSNATGGDQASAKRRRLRRAPALASVSIGAGDQTAPATVLEDKNDSGEYDDDEDELVITFSENEAGPDDIQAETNAKTSAQEEEHDKDGEEAEADLQGEEPAESDFDSDCSWLQEDIRPRFGLLKRRAALEAAAASTATTAPSAKRARQDTKKVAAKSSTDRLQTSSMLCKDSNKKGVAAEKPPAAGVARASNKENCTRILNSNPVSTTPAAGQQQESRPRARTLLFGGCSSNEDTSFLYRMAPKRSQRSITASSFLLRGR